MFGKQFDKYFLGIIVSMGSAGIYSISQRISNFSFLLMGTLKKVYSPIVYDKMFNDPSIKGSRDIGLSYPLRIFNSLFRSCDIYFF